MAALMDIDWDKADWGSVPEWVAAVGTTLALGFSLLILFKQRTLISRQLTDRHRDQASKVSAWVSTEPEGRTLVVTVRNTGESPVHECSAEIVDPDDPSRRLTNVWAVIPPQGDERWQRIDERDQWVLASLTFTDEAGTRWQRKGADLYEVDEDNPASQS